MSEVQSGDTSAPAATQMQGIDMSVAFTANAADCLQSAGVSFIGRYYTSIPDDPKLLTGAEAQSICAAGFEIVALYEDDGTTFSAQFGKQNAQAALQLAQNIGQPFGTAIYFAVDYDASADDLSGRIIPYFRAVNAAIGGAYAVGVYGSGLVCQSLLGAELASYAWLSMSTAFRGSADFDRWNVKQSATTTICELSIDPDVAIPPFGAFTVAP